MRGRVAVPIACSLIATMLSFSAATAAYGIPAETDRVALYQEAAQDASTGEWVEPGCHRCRDRPSEQEALADSTGSDDPAQDEWTDPAPVDPASSAPEVDPAAGEWIDPAAVKEAEPAPVDPAPVAPAPSVAPAPPSTLGSGGASPGESRLPRHTSLVRAVMARPVSLPRSGGPRRLPFSAKVSQLRFGRKRWASGSR